MSSDSNLPSSPEGSTAKHQKTTDLGLVPRIDIDTKTIVGDEAVTGGEGAVLSTQVGEKIGKYEIRAHLGAGGMGAVYLAFDSLIEREVAIKVLSQDVAASNVALQRFLQEARSIGRLNHPNVVSIYDIDQWNGQYYLVMELLSGGSLADLVDERGPLPWQEACGMIAQAALGLEAAHTAGMVHRDIKPENLMQTKEGIVKVVDFGLSKLVDAANDTRTAVTKQGQILGTPQYMSPEQFESTEVDSRTDIYSLGASLFRLATARFPYQDCASIVQTMMAHLTKPVPQVVEFNSQIPAECDRIIQLAMAKKPADRYQHAHQMADDLIALVQRHGGHFTGSAPTRVVQQEKTRASTVITDRAVKELQPLENRTVLLRTVMIVEPSKMMAAIMKDAVIRAGATRVDVCSSVSEAVRGTQNLVPNLLITAMQLSDGLAIQMIEEICRKSSLAGTCLVLTSSDSTMEQLIAAGPAASRVLAPKKVRPDDVLRVVHAAGTIQIDQGPIALPLDPLNLRLVIMTDLEKIPTVLTDLIRTVGLLDVAIVGITDVASIPSDDVPTVVLRLSNSTATSGEPRSRIGMPGFLSDARQLLAEIGVDSDILTLQTICRHGVIASTKRHFDSTQLTYLLQACRVS